MTPSAWIAVGTFIVLQTASIAFALGRLFQRVAAVEKGNDALAALTTSVTRMEVNVLHLTTSVDDLKEKLAWATEVAPIRPSRQRAAK